MSRLGGMRLYIMRTPTAYTNSLKNNTISMQMLSDCLYSSNKRAKNWRDKERECRDRSRNNRYWYDVHNNEEKAREKKEEYYQQKEIMLSILKPVCIHRERVGYERRRIYDYEPDYVSYTGEYVWENSYYDREEDRRVYFGDIEISNKPIYNYYLFYDFGTNHTFHIPINDIEAYNLEIKDIDHLKTTGYDIADLLSNQFVKKVIDLISSNNFKLIS